MEVKQLGEFVISTLSGVREEAETPLGQFERPISPPLMCLSLRTFCISTCLDPFLPFPSLKSFPTPRVPDTIGLDKRERASSSLFDPEESSQGDESLG